MSRRQIGPDAFRNAVVVNAPLPQLQPYRRCECGTCSACKSNQNWDRVFAKFEVKDYTNQLGVFRSPLSDI